MKLLLLSDLHLEVRPFDLPKKVDADVCILAGDICAPGYYGRMMRMLRGWKMPTVVVLGNHDHWYDQCGPAMETSGQLRDALSSLGDNFHVLDCSQVTIDGVVFAGGTLWTDFELLGTPDKSKLQAYRGINDFVNIGVSAGQKADRLNPDNMVAGHARCREAIRTAKKNTDGPIVVVTHFLPSPRAVANQFAGHPLNAYFASDCEDLMGDQVGLWAFGHTHTSCDFAIRGTRCVCNPSGYSDAENPDFNARKVIEV